MRARALLSLTWRRKATQKNIPPVLSGNRMAPHFYATSDLATIIEREKRVSAGSLYLYVVDKRQELHFVQVSSVAKKAGIVKEDTLNDFPRFRCDDQQGRRSV